jgi:hypothetical protein
MNGSVLAVAGGNEVKIDSLSGTGCLALSEHEGSVRMWSTKPAATVTHDTKVTMGVTCVVRHDLLPGDNGGQ